MSRVKIRVNEQILAREVRLIQHDGEQLGVLPLQEALKTAVSQGMDLVEVSSTARPIVCRIMDYGKFKYEQSKKAREAKKNQRTITIKEIKFRPKIGEHDYQVKLGKISHFLANPENKVKVTMMFRGREMSHVDIGRELLERVVSDLEEDCVVESRPRLEGRNMTMLLVAGSPKKKKEIQPKRKKDAQDKDSKSGS